MSSSDDDQPPPPPPPRFSTPEPDFDPLLGPEQSRLSPASLRVALPLIAETTLPGERVSTYEEWLAPPDPSINHWIAHKARQEDTFQWFLNGDAYKAWKTSGTLYWVRGKCAYLVIFHLPCHSIQCPFPSRLGQDPPYVRDTMSSSPVLKY
jgi:hypothetical protein